MYIYAYIYTCIDINFYVNYLPILSVSQYTNRIDPGIMCLQMKYTNLKIYNYMEMYIYIYRT